MSGDVGVTGRIGHRAKSFRIAIYDSFLRRDESDDSRSAAAGIPGGDSDLTRPAVEEHQHPYDVRRARREPPREATDYFTYRLRSAYLGDQRTHRSASERHVDRVELRCYPQPVASLIVNRRQLVAESELREEWSGAFDRGCVCEEDRCRAECAHPRRLGADSIAQRIVSKRAQSRKRVRLPEEPPVATPQTAGHPSPN